MIRRADGRRLGRGAAGGRRRGGAASGRRLTAAGLLAVLLLVAGCGLEPPEELPQRTPLEANQYERLTTHRELVDFLRFLEVSERVTVRELGTSVEGREIPYLHVSSGAFGEDREKVTALFFAQQHGNEPAGKEGALALALELARGDHDDLLEHVDLLLVPQVNPDGGEEHRRTNGDAVDPNRSHLNLESPEVAALRELFHRWEPEVAVDVHEYYPWSRSWLEEGWLRLFDMQVGVPTNLNTDAEVRGLAEEGFMPRVEEDLAEAGFSFHNYLVGSPEYLRWSTTDINDGRQGLAILNTLSFIFEGKRSEPEAADIERRHRAHRLAMESLLRFAAENRPEVLAAVHGARERLEAGEVDDLVLVMDRERSGEALELPVEAVEQRGDGEGGEGDAERPEEAWAITDTVTAGVEAWHPDVVAEETVGLPTAYLVDGAEEGVLDLLGRHRVEMEVLAEAAALRGERFVITGTRTVEIHDNERTFPAVEVREGTLEAEAGDVLVPTDQLRGLMAATALDPASMHGLWSYEDFEHLTREGPHPVARVYERE